MPPKKKPNKKSTGITGRPKKEPDLLPKNWEQEVIVLYSNGASDVEIRAWMCNFLDTLHPQTWRNWIMRGELAEAGETEGLTPKQAKEYIHFMTTIKKGRLLSQAWWESRGRMGLLLKDFNSTLWYMNMKNRFGWKDKPDESNAGDVHIYVSETVTELKKVS